jgi:hypothetical protein
MVFTVEHPDGISGNDCRVLGADEAVIAAGGAGTLGESHMVVFDRSPGVEYVAQPMTIGAIRIMTRGAPSPGWTLGTTALAELGVSTGDWIQSGPHGGVVMEEFGQGVRKLGYDRDVIRPVTSTGRVFEVCWVEFEPSAYGIAAEVLASRFSAEASVRPFHRTDPSDHPAALYRDRPSQYGWLVAAWISSVIWFGWFWTQRRTLVLYRSLGVTQAGIVVMGTAESTLTTVAAAAMAVSATAAISTSTEAAASGIASIVAAAVLAILINYASLLVLATRNVAAAARDL